MKTTLKSLAGLMLAIGLATSASAQRANNTWQKTPMKAATSQEEIQKLKKGDHYATVCMECKSITVKEVADDKEVEALCHDGGTIHCPSCKKDFKVSTGPRGEVTGSKVTYVNADGKECMFIVPMKDQS